MLMTKS